MPKTLFEKIWQDHLVADLGDGSSLLHIDRVFLHERTGSIALSGMAEKNRPVKNPRHAFCTMDHIIDTFPGRGDDTTVPGGREFITRTRREARRAGITLFDVSDPDQGISHVISAEQGIALPGLTVVCPDSHTCTLGALGALAWGIGSSDCEHALATETLRVVKPQQMGVCLEGRLLPGVTAKDAILHLIGKYTAAGGSGYAIEFHGPGIAHLPMEARMTLCNMAVEFSAFTGLVAPDDATLEYSAGRRYSPAGGDWDAARAYWRKLHTDEGAVYDRELCLDLAEVEPTVTWGTSPQHVTGVSAVVPDPNRGTRCAHAPGHAAGAGLHGSQGWRRHDFDSHRRRVHRLLHQQPPQRPARRGRRAQRQQGCRAASRQSVFPVPARSNLRRSGKDCTRFSWTPDSSGARRAAPYVSMPEAKVSLREHASLPAPTATLKDARVRGCVRTWRVRRPWRRRR